MRAVFYRDHRYETFCRASLIPTGTEGSAIAQAIRTARLLRAVSGRLKPAMRDLMLAALLLYPAGVIEAKSGTGKLYPMPVLSVLMIHDAQVSMEREKRATLESLILQAAWLAGEPGVAPAETTQHEAELIALCLKLEQRAAGLAAPLSHALRWSGQAPCLQLIDPPRKVDHDDRYERRTAAG
jgi:hypothetical protein